MPVLEYDQRLKTLTWQIQIIEKKKEQNEKEGKREKEKGERKKKKRKRGSVIFFVNIMHTSVDHRILS